MAGRDNFDQEVKARFTSALRQPCTCLRTHFWGISCGSLKTILRFARPQGCRNVVRRIFNMFIFLAFFGRCLEVARQLQGSLEMTARLTCEFAPSDTWAAANQSLRLSHEGRRVNARLSQERKTVARMLRSVRQLQTVAQQLHGCPAADVRLPFPVKDI